MGPGHVITSDPKVAVDVNGRLNVFALGTDSALWTIAQPNPGTWTGAKWVSLGGNLMAYP